MQKQKKKKKSVSPIYTFALTWLVLSLIFPLHKIWGLLITVALCSFTAFIAGRISAKRRSKEEAAEQQERQAEEKQAQPRKKSYGPEIDPILEEGNRALSEMGRLYMSIKDVEVRQKINEIMRITDKITQDAINDPSDIPQIKKFMNYYLPTTIKLLNAYDRMSAQGIEGENLDKSMKNINEMLDAAIVAYKKRLDSLFANQALDIETDIEVMNTMLAREGLTGGSDFRIKQDN
ncbi:MAG: 5-bromo-4-chloroindolyl phosphate hydrolysis family protein [Clostridiales bacterium]|nr:5-bromo-4-chloroindolyl phosphate hydrolysis family protein [Clostridiales bacterium]